MTTIRKTPTNTRALLVTVVLLAALLAGCASSEPAPPADTPGAVGADVSHDHATSAAGGQIDMKDVAYVPATLTVRVGTTVTWTNRDPFGHTVTPTDDAEWGSEGSGDEQEKWLDQGGSWGFTFTKPGTYKYYCVPHASKGTDGEWRGMVGTVVVET